MAITGNPGDLATGGFGTGVRGLAATPRDVANAVSRGEAMASARMGGGGQGNNRAGPLAVYGNEFTFTDEELKNAALSNAGLLFGTPQNPTVKMLMDIKKQTDASPKLQGVLNAIQAPFKAGYQAPSGLLDSAVSTAMAPSGSFQGFGLPEIDLSSPITNPNPDARYNELYSSLPSVAPMMGVAPTDKLAAYMGSQTMPYGPRVGTVPSQTVMPQSGIPLNTVPPSTSGFPRFDRFTSVPSYAANANSVMGLTVGSPYNNITNDFAPAYSPVNAPAGMAFNGGILNTPSVAQGGMSFNGGLLGTPSAAPQQQDMGPLSNAAVSAALSYQNTPLENDIAYLASRVGPNASPEALALVEPRFVTELAKEIRAAEAATNTTARINDLYRSPDTQGQLYTELKAQNPNYMVAPAGQSWHQAAVAADIARSPVLDYMRANVPASLNFPYDERDLVHVQLSDPAMASLGINKGTRGAFSSTMGDSGFMLAGGDMGQMAPVQVAAAPSPTPIQTAAYTGPLPRPRPEGLISSTIPSQNAGLLAPPKVVSPVSDQLPLVNRPKAKPNKRKSQSLTSILFDKAMQRAMERGGEGGRGGGKGNRS